MVIKVVSWLDFEFRFLLESVYLSSRDKCGLLFQTAASYRAQVVEEKPKDKILVEFSILKWLKLIQSGFLCLLFCWKGML